MALEKFVSRELDRVVESASATAIQLSAIGVEMRAVLHQERHDPALSATVLAAHAKRAALALASLAGLVGQIDTLARIGAL